MRTIGKPTSLLKNFLPKVLFARAITFLRPIIVGVFLGVIAVLFHNSYSPFGLVVALLESSFGIYYFAKTYRGRALPFIAMAAWTMVIYKAGSFGVSDEILIEGNINGFILLIGGMGLNLFALIKARKLN